MKGMQHRRSSTHQMGVDLVGADPGFTAWIKVISGMV